MTRSRRPFGKRGVLKRRVVESRRRLVDSKARTFAWEFKRAQSILASFEAMGYAGQNAYMDRLAFTSFLNCRSAPAFDRSAFDSVVMWGTARP